MQTLILVSKGIEDIAKTEIKEIIGKDAAPNSGSLIVDCTKEELVALAYQSQSIEHALVLKHNFSFDKEPFDQIEKAIDSLELNETVRVESLRIGTHDFNSQDIMNCIAKALKKKEKSLDQKNGTITLFIYTRDQDCYVTIDPIGRELFKRDYRIFTSTPEIRATIAYAMVRMSKFNKSQTLLDPFAVSGTIPIEAAFFNQKKPIHFYEKVKFPEIDFEKIDENIREQRAKIFCIDANNAHIVFAKKNAKIAGVNKTLEFSRLDVTSLDVKFEENSVDLIVTKLPDLRRDGNPDKIKELYDAFFYNAKFILNNGKIVVMSKTKNILLEKAEKHSFKLLEERSVEMGKDTRTIFSFSQ